MPNRLQNKIALITGSSGALGRSIALAYAREGALVCCADLYPAPRKQTNADTGKAADFNDRVEAQESTIATLTRLYPAARAHFVRCDVTSAESVEAAVAECVRVFGRLDVLVNNAGISVESTQVRPLPVHELEEADWERTMAVNAKGVFLGCKFGIAQMLRQECREGERDRGWVVNTSSVQGLVAYTNTPAYTASKSAVAGLTRQVALDYAPHRIHVNALCPGFLRTTMTQNLQSDPVAQAEIDKAHPFGGMGSTEDVAKVAVFLASEDVAWVTGVNVPVDGGYTAM